MCPKSESPPGQGATTERVLRAVRTIGRGARLNGIAALARYRASDAAEVQCELEAQGLVAVWSWEPVRTSTKATR